MRSYWKLKKSIENFNIETTKKINEEKIRKRELYRREQERKIFEQKLLNQVPEITLKMYLYSTYSYRSGKVDWNDKTYYPPTKEIKTFNIYRHENSRYTFYNNKCVSITNENLLDNNILKLTTSEYRITHETYINYLLSPDEAKSKYGMRLILS